MATLLTLLCRNWGLCGFSTEDWRKITNSRRIDAREFAIAVLKADGPKDIEYDPETEVELMRRIKGRFIEYFGKVEVSEDEFREDNPETQT